MAREVGGWAEQFADVLTARPRALLALIGLVGLASLAALPAARFDASVERLMVQDDATMADLREAKRIFGNDDFLVVAQIGEDPISDAGRFERLRTLGDAIAQVGGVTQVWSLAVGGRAGVAEALANPIYRRQLVSADGRTAAILVFPEDRPQDSRLRERLVRGVREAVAAYAGPERVVVTGSPVISEDIGQAMQGDMVRFSALTVGVLALILLPLFRSAWAVVLSIAAVGIATLAVIACMTAFGHSISVLTTTIPTMILSIGATYAVYLVEHWASAEGDPRARARAALGDVGLPVVVSSLTTIIGFVSLAVTRIPAIREFSILGAVGVAVVTPAVLGLLPVGLAAFPPRLRRPRPGDGSWSERLLGAAAGVLRCRRRTAVIASVALLAVIGAGVARLRVDTSYLSWLPADHRTSRDFEELTQRLGGMMPLYVIVDTGRSDGALDPDLLARVAAVQRDTTRLPLVDTTFSLADVLAEANHAVHAGAPNPELYRVIPESPALAALYLRQYAMQTEGLRVDYLDRLVSGDRRWLAVWIRTNLLGSHDAEETAAAIRASLRAHLPDVRAYVTSTVYALYHSGDEIALGQARGLGTAVLAISATVIVMVRSLRLGLIAIPTNLLPILCLFGVMGALGVTLNMSTALIASVCLGVVVDDTVHFVLAYQRALDRLGEPEAAMAEAFHVMGRAVIFNSLALAGAFLVLTASSFRPVADLGWLTAVALICGLAADLLLLPALLQRFARSPLHVPTRASGRAFANISLEPRD